LPAPPADPFRCFVWETLSARTTPARRDAAYQALLRMRALTPDAIARAPYARLTAAVTLAETYHEQRLHALLAGAELFRRHPSLTDELRDSLPAARRAVARLPRVSEADRHRLLLFGGNHCVMPVDRDTARLCVRLGFDVPETEPRRLAGQIRRLVEAVLPHDADTFRRTALYLRHHAGQTCTELPHCQVCPVADVCPSSRGRER
jgi:endonuclease III